MLEPIKEALHIVLAKVECVLGIFGWMLGMRGDISEFAPQDVKKQMKGAQVYAFKELDKKHKEVEKTPHGQVGAGDGTVGVHFLLYSFYSWGGRSMEKAGGRSCCRWSWWKKL